jgi:predicted metal-dependent phosphoesterase TrpH
MFDLHFHTLTSDGEATLDVVRERLSARADLVRVALTDHDTFTSSALLAETEPRAWVGAEITSFTGGTRIDLLALGARPDDGPLLRHFAERSVERRARFLRYGELLAADGWTFAPSPETVAREVLASPHVMAELRRHPENLARLAAAGVPLEVPVGSDPGIESVLHKYNVKSEDGSTSMIEGPGMIAMIHAAGGLAVVAHPWIAPYGSGRQTWAKARRLLLPLLAAGADGLEFWHPDQVEVPRAMAEIRAQAAAHDMVLTAGSDDHTPDMHRLGEFQPPADEAEAVLTSIEAAWRRRQAAAPRRS